MGMLGILLSPFTKMRGSTSSFEHFQFSNLQILVYVDQASPAILSSTCILPIEKRMNTLTRL